MGGEFSLAPCELWTNKTDKFTLSRFENLSISEKFFKTKWIDTIVVGYCLQIGHILASIIKRF